MSPAPPLAPTTSGRALLLQPLTGPPMLRLRCLLASMGVSRLSRPAQPLGASQAARSSQAGAGDAEAVAERVLQEGLPRVPGSLHVRAGKLVRGSTRGRRAAAAAAPGGGGRAGAAPLVGVSSCGTPSQLPALRPAPPSPLHPPSQHLPALQDVDSVANRALKEAARELERQEAAARQDHTIPKGGMAAEAQVRCGGWRVFRGGGWSAWRRRGRAAGGWGFFCVETAVGFG